MTTAITLAREAQVETFRFSTDQRKLILDTCCGGASPSEAHALIGIAEMRGLNPLTGECFFVQRWDSQKQRMVWAVQISIDAMRIKAEESGLYAGQDEPEYEYEAGSKVPTLARVKVYRRDWDRPCVGVARYSEYVQRKKDGYPTRFWADMPHNQLAKCAEALSLRKAFPKRLAKLYTPEEMAQAENDVPDALPARPASTPPPAMHEGGLGSAVWSGFQAELTQAQTLEAIKAIGVRIKAAAGKMTLTQVGTLRELTKERQKAIKAGEKDMEKIFEGNVLPESWGGPPDTDAVEETCVVCGKPLGASAAVQMEDDDGVVRYRHAGCAAREPGED